MIVYNKIKPDLVEKASCALGMFDGVHVGHRQVINTAKNAAIKHKCQSVVVTFKEHPQFITTQTPALQLTTLEERLDLFEEIGVDVALIINFDLHIAEMSPIDYIRTVLIDSLHARSITIGYDHHFGKGKKGNKDLLLYYSDKFNYTLNIVPPVSLDGQIISSSIIRKLLQYGEVAQAAKLLNRYHNIKGTIIKGDQIGRKLGFPTANIRPLNNNLVPDVGVYNVDIKIENSDQIFNAVLNIGFKPTFGVKDTISIEAHILNFSENIYKKDLSIYFKNKIRDEIKFKSPEELVKQIKKDIESIQQCL